MELNEQLATLALDYRSDSVGRSRIVQADCFEWLGRIPESSLYAIVTDPPYGVKEYDLKEIEKREAGRGGIWRIPPSFDGSLRSPLPRFTALNSKERETLREFFVLWARAVLPALRPGAHVFIAGNSFLSLALIHRSAWNRYSRKLDFHFTEFLEAGQEFIGNSSPLASVGALINFRRG
jgi:DNA modification methylase